MTISLIDRFRDRLPVSETTPVDFARGGLDPADPGVSPLRALRDRPVAEARVGEPDGQLQGSRYDGRGVQGGRGGRAGGHLRVDREHRGLGGGVRSPRRDTCRRPATRRGGDARQARSGAGGGSPRPRGTRHVRRGAHGSTGARPARCVRARQLGQPAPDRGAEDSRLRDRRRSSGALPTPCSCPTAAAATPARCFSASRSSA